MEQRAVSTRNGMQPLTNEQGKRICGRNKQHGGICESTLLMANGCCIKHGGKSLRGVAHPNYKNAGYSKVDVLPQRYREAFLQSLSDHDYLVLHEEVALTKAREQELLSLLDANGSRDTLKAAIDTLHVVLSENEDTRLHNVIHMLSTNLQQYSLWDNIQQTQEHKRKLVDTERKRLDSVQGRLSKEQSVLFVTFVLNLLAKYIPDTTERQKAILELKALVDGQGSTR